jgi:hypothetical protein
VHTSTITHNGKTSTRPLLRESYREQGQVTHRTLANVRACSPEAIEAIRLALRHTQDLSHLGAVHAHLGLRHGFSVGALWLVDALAQQGGRVRALGTTRAGHLALWHVRARGIAQGARRSAVRCAGRHAGWDVLGLEQCNEEELYENLEGLCDQQTTMADQLAQPRLQGRRPGLLLYAVTSRDGAGEQHALAAFGSHRDGKQGKRPSVLGLGCDAEGNPCAIEVVPGHTPDPPTVAAHRRQVTARCGGGPVVLVGERGMRKGPHMAALVHQGLHDMTAIPKPPIARLRKNAVRHSGLCEDAVTAVLTSAGLRSMLRRNQSRAQEVQPSREAQYQTRHKAVEKHNRSLTQHPRAHGAVALRTRTAQCTQWQRATWVSVAAAGRRLALSRERAAQQAAATRDGCSVILTELTPVQMRQERMHAREKDVALVAWACRSCKTTHRERRPLSVHVAKRTRAHALGVMLASHIIQELRARWQPLHLTVEEGITALAPLCSTAGPLQGQKPYHAMPAPRDLSAPLLEAAHVRLPRRLPSTGIVVATKKRLQTKRKGLKHLCIFIA